MDKLLIVDDDLSILKVLKMRLESKGYSVTTATKVRPAIEAAERKEFDLALLDLKLAKANGIELMENLHDIDPELPIIMLTAYGTIESAVEAMKRGAYSYLTKPFDYRELLLQIKNAIEKTKLSREVKNLRRIVDHNYKLENIIGQSAAMKKLLDSVSLAAETNSNIYIQGESGTGKGLIARVLHQLSPRKYKPFIPINCSAILETLLETELFGYEKGPFTGAVSSKKGLFVQAHGGIIFLDEIAEIPLSMQSKLLKALEEKEFYPLGAQKTVKVDAVIISASKRDLELEVEKGRFRPDLFYRINVIPIKVPPLRERREDIPLLAEHFLNRFKVKMKKDIQGFSASAIQRMMSYSWPGNVRELENVVECAVVMGRGEIITEDLLIIPDQNQEDKALNP